MKPTHRFMSSYEQKVEPWDKKYQYVVFACDPCETIAFKIPNVEIATRGGASSKGLADVKPRGRKEVRRTRVRCFLRIVVVVVMAVVVMVERRRVGRYPAAERDGDPSPPPPPPPPPPPTM